MQRTAESLKITVGEDKYPLVLTDSAVEAVQGEASGRVVSAFAGLWEAEQEVQGGEGFDSLDLNALLTVRDHLRAATEAVDVLIECRPLDELDTED
jgi:hypothetical protein